MQAGFNKRSLMNSNNKVGFAERQSRLLLTNGIKLLGGFYAFTARYFLALATIFHYWQTNRRYFLPDSTTDINWLDTRSNLVCVLPQSI
jgi:hypothetical protein